MKPTSGTIAVTEVRTLLDDVTGYCVQYRVDYGEVVDFVKRDRFRIPDPWGRHAKHLRMIDLSIRAACEMAWDAVKRQREGKL